MLSFEGAWAQNINEDDTYIDFIGDKGGIRMQYCGGFKLYTVQNGMLCTTEPSFVSKPMHQTEVLDFVASVRKGERSRNDISKAIHTSRIMQGIYDSSAAHHEVTID